MHCGYEAETTQAHHDAMELALQLDLRLFCFSIGFSVWKSLFYCYP